MLRITIELWPFGDSTQKRIIGDLCITNTGRIPDLTGPNEYKVQDLHAGTAPQYFTHIRNLTVLHCLHSALTRLLFPPTPEA